MMLVAACALSTAFAAAADAKCVAAHKVDDVPETLSFDEWRNAFGKVYSAEEYERREAIYQANVRHIHAHNARGRSWRMGVNHMSDLAPEEFARTYLSPFQRQRPAGHETWLPAPAADASVDWRTQGAVTPVKNQGRCGEAPTRCAPRIHNA